MECKGPLSGASFCLNHVLIETLWNVKIDSRLLLVILLRINRNIMECKDRSPFAFFERIPVLIETLWNVKIETVLNTLHQAVVY